MIWQQQLCTAEYLRPAVLGLLSLTLCLSPVGAEEQLRGRLFTTPDQRAELDKLRSQQAATGVKKESEGGASTRLDGLPEARPFRLDGIVVRSRGPSSVWINGKPVSRTSAAPQGMDIRPQDIHATGVTVRLPSLAEPVRIKPGQTYDPSRNRALEAIELQTRRSEDGGRGER